MSQIQLESIREISQRNMALFYKDRLIRVHQGELASNLFNKCERRTLKYLGLIERIQDRPPRMILTSRAKECLQVSI